MTCKVPGNSVKTYFQEMKQSLISSWESKCWCGICGCSTLRWAVRQHRLCGWHNYVLHDEEERDDTPWLLSMEGRRSSEETTKRHAILLQGRAHQDGQGNCSFTSLSHSYLFLTEKALRIVFTSTCRVEKGTVCLPPENHQKYKQDNSYLKAWLQGEAEGKPGFQI